MQVRRSSLLRRARHTCLARDELRDPALAIHHHDAVFAGGLRAILRQWLFTLPYPVNNIGRLYVGVCGRSIGLMEIVQMSSLRVSRN